MDPDVSEAAREYDWPKPERRKVGRGEQFIYDGGLALGQSIVEHLEGYAEVWGSAQADPDARADARQCRRDAERVKDALAHHRP